MDVVDPGEAADAGDEAAEAGDMASCKGRGLGPAAEMGRAVAMVTGDGEDYERIGVVPIRLRAVAASVEEAAAGGDGATEITRNAIRFSQA